MAERHEEKLKFENVELLQSLIGGGVPRPIAISGVKCTKTDARRIQPSAAAPATTAMMSRSSQELARVDETAPGVEPRTAPRTSWREQSLKSEPSLLSLFSPLPLQNNNASVDAALGMPDLPTNATILSGHQNCTPPPDKVPMRRGDDLRDSSPRKGQDREHSVPRTELAQLTEEELRTTTGQPLTDTRKNTSQVNSTSQTQTGLQALFEHSPSLSTHRTSVGDPRHILGAKAVSHKEKWSDHNSLRATWSSPDITGHQKYILNPGSPSSPASTQSQPILDGRRVSLPTTARRSSENVRPQRTPATPQELSILFAHTAVLKPRLHREIHELDANSSTPSDEIHELEVPPIPEQTTKEELMEPLPSRKEKYRDGNGSDAKVSHHGVPQSKHDGDVTVQEWLRKSRMLQPGQSV